jgi:hypothetical protein
MLDFERLKNVRRIPIENNKMSRPPKAFVWLLGGGAPACAGSLAQRRKEKKRGVLRCAEF